MSGSGAPALRVRRTAPHTARHGRWAAPPARRRLGSLKARQLQAYFAASGRAWKRRLIDAGCAAAKRIVADLIERHVGACRLQVKPALLVAAHHRGHLGAGMAQDEERAAVRQGSGQDRGALGPPDRLDGDARARRDAKIGIGCTRPSALNGGGRRAAALTAVASSVRSPRDQPGCQDFLKYGRLVTVAGAGFGGPARPAAPASSSGVSGDGTGHRLHPVHAGTARPDDCR